MGYRVGDHPCAPVEPIGFDDWHVLPGQGRYFDPEFVENGRRTQHKGYVTDIITAMTLEQLRSRPKDKPFCMIYQHKAPHDPWQYDEAHAGLYRDTDIPEPENLFDDLEGRPGAVKQHTQYIGAPSPGHTLHEKETGHITDPAERRRAQYQIYLKRYLRVVASIDDNVGRVLDYLDEEGLAENTVVIYTSDQGFFLGEHGWYDKRFMYEESLRMPFVIRYPRAIAPGSTDDHICLNIDFASTLLDYGGVDVPKQMQGESFRGILEGNVPQDWRKSMYYRYYYSHFNTPAHWGIRTQNHKLVYYHDSGQWELYDIKKDPMEMNNLYGKAEAQELVDELKVELERLRDVYRDTESAEEGDARAAAALGRAHPFFKG